MTETRKKRAAHKPDALELIVTWISGALFLSVLGFLLWDARQPSRPVSFETAIESQSQRGSSTYVTVAVRNLGDEAARAVMVRVVSEAGEAAPQAHFTLDWLPGRSTRRGVAVFPPGFSSRPIRAEVSGYARP
jgi:uncharacterized protein (TIGR02588 family)